MSEYAVEINLPDAKLGDVWPPSPDGSGLISIGPILINGSTPSVELDRVVMRFEKNGVCFVFDSEIFDRNAPITITDNVAWTAEIPPVSEFLTSPGEWEWEMLFYSGGSSAPLTMYYGVITVVEYI